MWCRPYPSSVSPMYCPARLPTASRPRSTLMHSAPESLSASRLRPGLAGAASTGSESLGLSWSLLMRNLIRLSSCRGGGNAALGRARVRLDGPVVDRPILDRKELRMAFEALEVGGV